MDKFVEILGTAGFPSGFVGICLMLLFYIRKQESGVRTDINGSLQRLTAETLDLKEEIDTLKDDHKKEVDALKAELTAREATIDLLRTERRAAEDREDQQRRRAEAAEAKLGDRDV